MHRAIFRLHFVRYLFFPFRDPEKINKNIFKKVVDNEKKSG